ncbi:hypothetical protein ENU1_041320 [Entamoeba nuttalli P19]|uniref:Uncharacterized protein n=1 Tax=Entamoeba nuttalli (strain P19) TaxID=1076696 RepID=K2H605_ENTNP|nr:hypothetical protein ENU1_041320 [Entamoeba nuttalli P19]EKE41882.1 hypothetical protein ENU1_041320 [Entamoeba nuttalli P19]|eukprot:XP_008855783.1 hypothetical protein ENU1_041320 [Entamoeba nuttalli P19]
MHNQNITPKSLKQYKPLHDWIKQHEFTDLKFDIKKHLPTKDEDIKKPYNHSETTTFKSDMYLDVIDVVWMWVNGIDPQWLGNTIKYNISMEYNR